LLRFSLQIASPVAATPDDADNDLNMADIAEDVHARRSCLAVGALFADSKESSVGNFR
jgi:hypothetical protein